MEKIHTTFAPEKSNNLQNLSRLELNDKKRILTVDDSEDMRELLSVLLHNEGAVSLAINGMDALSQLKCNHFNIIVSDIEMPVMNGIDLYETVTRLYPRYRNHFLFFSGTSREAFIDYLSRHNLTLLRKPHDINKLRLAVHQMLVDNSEDEINIDKSMNNYIDANEIL